MHNTELLQSLCNTLNLMEDDLRALMAHCKHSASLGPEPNTETSLLQDCSNEQLRCALEGLILAERGPRTDGAPPAITNEPLSNNEVLKKLRIALNLQQEDMLLFFEEGGATLSQAELGALFRKEGNKHFRTCSDALLLQFLGGLQPSLDT